MFRKKLEEKRVRKVKKFDAVELAKANKFLLGGKKASTWLTR